MRRLPRWLLPAAGAVLAGVLAPGGLRAQRPRPATVVVRVLDVGQGDAIYIQNGASRVLVDGGPDARLLAGKLDSLGLRHTTLDAVILTHAHTDHAAGLVALFASARGLSVKQFFDNDDANAGGALAELRDSVAARAARHELVLRDTDDPCGDGRPICTLTLKGGARLRILRPEPRVLGSGNENDRSVALKLLAPDSARFTMWLAGDAEHEEQSWQDAAGYARDPGMHVDVLKADHHGSCNGISPRYLDLTAPKWVIASVAAHNGFGHMHEQTKTLLRARGVPWYRTDANGDVLITVPPRRGHFTVTPSRGATDADGPSDRVSTQKDCS